MAVVKYKNSTGVVKTLPSVKVNLLDGLNEKIYYETENATLYSNTHPSIIGKTRCLIPKDGSELNIRLSETTLGDKQFNYFKNIRGEIVCYNTTYKTIAHIDDIITPVYSTNSVERQSLIYFVGKGYEVKADNRQVIFYMESDISNLDTKKGWGIVFTLSNLTEDELIIGGDGVKQRAFTTLVTNKMAHYSYTQPFSETSWAKHYKLLAKPYAIIDHEGVEQTIYGKAVAVQL